MGASAPIGGSCTMKPFGWRQLPSPPRGAALVHPSQGIKVHYLSYWHEVFRLPDVVRTRVPVRYDPFDLSVALRVCPRALGRVREPRLWGVPGALGTRTVPGHSRVAGAQPASTTSPPPLRPCVLPRFLAKIEAHEACCSNGCATRKPAPSCGSLTAGTTSRLPAGFLHPWAVREQEARPLAEDTGVSPVDLATLQVYEEYR